MSLTEMANEMVINLKGGNKILIAGNGGLAAESEHFAAELVGRFGHDCYLPCLALTGPSSLITALSNDIGYEYVFSHQVQVLGQVGDIFIGLTTSSSPNIIKAYKMAILCGLIGYLWDGQYLTGQTGAEKQEDAIRQLHELALKVKEIYAGRKSKQ